MIERTGVLALWRGLPAEQRVRLSRLSAWIGVTTLVFIQPLSNLMRLSLNAELHSHSPLVPFASAYLLYDQRRTFADSIPSWRGAAAFAAVALSSAATATVAHPQLTDTGYLGLMVLSYVSSIVAGGFLFLGYRWMTAAVSPLAFLIFMVPLPDAAVVWLEDVLVLASADVSAWMIQATGTPLFRDGTTFVLPTIALQVARECSGIRSTWVLLITSFVASHMFLTSPWRKLALVAFVIPLGIVRNGFRILTIALLCVNVGPHMIDSIIHHRGGPIFFALSLVPMFTLMWWLRRGERNT